MDYQVRVANLQDAPWMQDGIKKLGASKPVDYFESCCKQQERGDLVLLVAELNGVYLGHVKIKWNSGYAPFREQGIPEIQDLYVDPEYRRKGVGSMLLDVAEDNIRGRAPIAGIGVGLYSDYGPAQRMYVSRGYIPDGKAMVYEDAFIRGGEHIVADDDLTLHLTKELILTNSR